MEGIAIIYFLVGACLFFWGFHHRQERAMDILRNSTVTDASPATAALAGAIGLLLAFSMAVVFWPLILARKAFKKK